MTNITPYFLRLLTSLHIYGMVHGIDWPSGTYLSYVLRPIDRIDFNPGLKDAYLTDPDGVMYVAKYNVDTESMVSIALQNDDLEHLKRDFPEWINDDTFKEIPFDAGENSVTVNYMKASVTYVNYD
ncbi:hypothetical protein FOL47_009999 [Perkinsus chesapeaki]|uniref:Uncharacterized protein n=1 Tax=Perkinsus chesapeaki TaxID=330153 RepID=A0A7J6L5D1_PERCH|nr:hypothetical protein FOL47_009999 [Perkinsus chesapeaki]